MAHKLCELLWLLLVELGFPVSHPMALYCDNKAVISIAHNFQHDRIKHIEVDHTFFSLS